MLTGYLFETCQCEFARLLSNLGAWQPGGAKRVRIKLKLLAPVALHGVHACTEMSPGHVQ